MTRKAGTARNEYNCCMELNQSGKYCVRIHARFKRHDWVLPVYFLASTMERAVRKLEQSVQFLQQHEDRLWFWGVDRSDDPNISAEMLKEAGLRLDRRHDFPQRQERLAVRPEQRVPAFVLDSMRKRLAGSVHA